MAQPIPQHISGEEQDAGPLQKTHIKAIRSEDIVWKPFPAFPPSARLAIVVGGPTGSGLYTIRVKVPHGVKLMPHRHSEEPIYTVISGVFYIGLGDQFDADNLDAFLPGAVIILPGNTSHFQRAKSGEYITAGIGYGAARNGIHKPEG